ncbi:MAG: hypothetical protein JW821_05690 [Deltaproteobacteria bacterium]|nr:hypothetical protein [Deltaproteobacteria bacterium]
MLLIEGLKKAPIERLRLCIACRTFEWPLTLENGLKELWGENSVHVCELVPLRRVDVVEAVNANDLDSQEFLSEVDRIEAVPFAVTPVTLNFLINVYLKKGHLPRTKWDLYVQGCRLLCEDPSESRRESRLTGDLDPPQRMAVAARIAAVTIFANRYAIWTDLDRGNVPHEDVTISELLGRTESADGRGFDIKEKAVRETIGTALFSSRGPGRMGWSHQTYAEFLASFYLVERQTTFVQMMSLLAHGGDPEGRLVPQIHGVASWLATKLPELFQEIAVNEPEVLLRGDLATSSQENRAVLTDHLLKFYDEEKSLGFESDIRKGYMKLLHPGLADQLRPYIHDKKKGYAVRQVAIEIAEACRLEAMEADLLELTLDPSEIPRIRVDAAYAIIRTGNEETKKGMKGLLDLRPEDDPDNQLKGCALLALWPNHITAVELFATLTAPKAKPCSGPYNMFLAYRLGENLSPADIPTALNWVEGQTERRQLPDSFQKLMDSIFLVSWQNIEEPEGTAR